MIIVIMPSGQVLKPYSKTLSSTRSCSCQVLGLALAFVFTMPSATLCIENIFFCRVWRALPSPAVAPVGRLVQAVAPVLYALGRTRLLPVAGPGARGRVSIEKIRLVGGLALPGRLWLDLRPWLAAASGPRAAPPGLPASSAVGLVVHCVPDAQVGEA